MEARARPDLPVTGRRQHGTMPEELRGLPLRYLLIVILDEARGPVSIGELVARCLAEGVGFSGRPSKVLSDALRWDVRTGRVVRVRRGVYASGQVPESTMRWIRHRVAESRAWLRWAGAGGPLGDDGLPLGWEAWPRSSWVPAYRSWLSTPTVDRSSPDQAA